MTAKKAWVSALRMLAARRLSESQLRGRLQRREYASIDIEAAIDRARAESLVDDTLYAQLFVAGQARTVGNRRLLAKLIARGIARDTALAALETTAGDERVRLSAAYEKLCRIRPGLSLPAAARSLARLGFPTPAIYRFLAKAGAELFAGGEV